MPRISPRMSASLARDIYRLVDIPKLKDAVSELEYTYGSVMEINNSNTLKGKSGGPGFVKSRTGFGLCALGKGAYQGHGFIVLRGTKFLADWLTNLNVGVSRSCNGQSVHDGFNRAFCSMKPQIKPFVRALAANGVHSVHCIGHSLGGGLATLSAEYVKATTALTPNLYTFGAPRVGLRSFADTLSSNVGSTKIYRVYHQTDIVPCIPFWPFVHAPSILGDAYDYFQPSPGVFPGAKWHDMSLYVDTVGTQKWSALRNKRNRNNNSASVLNWLNREGPVSFSVTNLEWLDKAINYVLAKCLSFVGGTLTGAFSGTFTLMDQLAYILKKGVDLSSNLSGLVMALIRKIMKMLGMQKIIDKTDATAAFIRSIFQKLSHRISTYCQKALDNVLVNGQSV